MAEDVAWVKPLAAPNLTDFYSRPATDQAVLRNEIISTRMYITDLEYHKYEAKLTKELQDEGLLATVTNLGLTTSATLVPDAGTKTILSGIATAVTGLDKGYFEKDLLSNTIQALQTQMRVDRKTQAAVILAKMNQPGPNGTPVATPIDQYPLAMALSDTDEYYQSGTIGSAIRGLTKTVATAETNADIAKGQQGPNPDQVTAAKLTASPQAQQLSISAQAQQQVIASVNQPLPSAPQKPPSQATMTSNEHLTKNEIQQIQTALCVSPANGNIGGLPGTNDATRVAIRQFILGADRASTTLAALIASKADELKPSPYFSAVSAAVGHAALNGKVLPCSDASRGFMNAFEVGLYGTVVPTVKARRINDLQMQLQKILGTNPTVPASGELDNTTRDRIDLVRTQLKLSGPKGQIDSTFYKAVYSYTVPPAGSVNPMKPQ